MQHTFSAIAILAVAAGMAIARPVGAQETEGALRPVEPERTVVTQGAESLSRPTGPVSEERADGFLRPSNDPGEWITTADYTSAAIARNYEGTVSFDLTVSPEGTVSDCTVTGGSAPTRLKTLTCELIAQRARFDPARDADGDPIEGTYSHAVLWQIPEEQVRLLPEPAQWDYTFVIERDGSVSSCEIEILEGYTRNWACGFPAGRVYEPPVNDQGEPIRLGVRMKGSMVVEELAE